MSNTNEKITISELQEMKKDGEQIVMLTAYDYPTARLVEQGGVDMILVGDSLGMTVLGYKDTLPVTLQDIISHTQAVCRAVERPMVVADMPFMSFQVSKEDTLRNAGRIVKETQAEAVKVEGGEQVLPQVSALDRAGIPVMGHIGLTPQAVHQMGGFKVQGRQIQAAKELLVDAQLLQEAGVFSLVLEGIPAEVAREISKTLTIPTIGIGAGRHCDGQVLVFHDIVGMYDEFTPKFVRQYADVGEMIKNAVQEFSSDVRSGEFPSKKESFSADPEVIAQMKKLSEQVEEE